MKQQKARAKSCAQACSILVGCWLAFCCGLCFGRRRCRVLCDCGVQHGVELGDIVDLDKAFMGHDEDGGGFGEADAFAEGLIRVYLSGEETVLGRRQMASRGHEIESTSA